MIVPMGKTKLETTKKDERNITAPNARGVAFVFFQKRKNIIANKINKPVVNVITQTLVNKNDKAFHNPTKPIGPFYTKEQANELRKKGFHVIEDAGRGYRRVVPSPLPIKIIEKDPEEIGKKKTFYEPRN